MSEKFTGESKKDKVAPEKMVTVTFLEDRKYDLHIGRSMVTFMGRETKKIPAFWLKHPDWQNVALYFVVKGV